MTVIEWASIGLIVIGALIIIGGFLLAYKEIEGALTQAEGRVQGRGYVKIPAFLAVMGLGAFVIFLAVDLLSNSAVDAAPRVTSLSFVSSANAQPAGQADLTGWSYLGPQSDPQSWNFTVEGLHENAGYQAFADLINKAGEDGVALTVDRKVNIRIDHFSSLHGTFLGFLAGKEPNIVGSFSPEECAVATDQAVVGNGSVWIRVEQRLCGASGSHP